MIRKLRVLIFCLLAGSKVGLAQTADSVLQVVYLIGNTATSPVPAAHLAAFKAQIQTQQDPFIIIHLGDILSNRGFSDKQGQDTRQLDQLLELTAGKPRGRIYFIPGDKDWDNSGPQGLKNVRRLEAYLAARGPQARLLPGNGCPGPEVIDIGPGLRIIALNTQWWLHPYHKPAEPDTDCGIISRPEMIEALDDAMEEAAGRNVLLVGHHPLFSNGGYGGHLSLKKHLLPFTDFNPRNRIPLPGLGSLYAAYRQNVGTRRDMAHPDYQDLKQQLGEFLNGNSQLVYAAAHDFSLQLTRADDNYHLVSGSFAAKDFVVRNHRSLVNAQAPGYAQLTYYADGRVRCQFYAFRDQGTKQIYSGLLLQSGCGPARQPDIPVNQQVAPCRKKKAEAAGMDRPAAGEKRMATVAAGPEYRARALKEMFFGSLYRQSWIQPVQVSYLYLSQTPAQLRPYKIGGGRQTTSLRLRTANGRQYVFRSVHKDPVGVLPPELRNTVVTDVLRDIMATEQPYGAMAVARLLDATDILHARPGLYVLGDEAALGPFRQKYAGMFGMLEERPLGAKGNRPGFGGASNVKNTYDFFGSLYKDHDHRVDVRAYGQARAFDMLIGDWGRHPDNWRWAGYKQGKTTLYRPIPRDRDHAFSRWNGLFPWIADRSWGLPNVQDFNTRFNGVKSLTWSARHQDRALLSSLDRRDWQQIAATLQQQLTDPVIEAAVASFPPEIASRQGAQIGRRLKARREKLPAAVDTYYRLLARYVDVLGSNKSEYVRVERLPGARVRVQVFEKDSASQAPEGAAYFDRTFLKSETREIRLYGLDGRDVFVVSGTVPESIRLRIIGGDGQDSIRDASAVKGTRKYTLVYDNTGTRLALGAESKDLTSDARNINAYDRQAFEYNSYNPNGALLYNRSDGLGITAGTKYKRQRFRQPGYGSLYGFQLRATQNGNRQLTGNFLWRQALGPLDVGALVDVGQYFRFYNFFGLGNNTVKDDARYDNDYYQARYSGVISQIFLQQVFFQKSRIRLGPTFESLQTDFDNTTFLGESQAGQFNTARQQLAGLAAELSLDLRDKPVFTQRGVRLLARHSSYRRLNSSQRAFGLSEGFLDYYGSLRLLVPVTLALRLGGARNYGRELPFFKYTALGLQQYLRGYVINRFSGDASAYFNTELRIHIGQVSNPFLPFRYGLLAFYDQGRVWYRGSSPGGWHEGYGGGFYISPLAERFTFSTLLQHSPEERLLIQIGAGFRFDL